MYLKDITINGFKSFANRTRINLSPGITMIVGPNGCGKSNIVDAVRWVLGEKSAKSLRGGKMQDVIFEGTDKRKALPMCEVSLTFGDCESALKTDFNEVEVSRRVTRDGNSDYLINGKRCRLKDVQQLFMDTGVGRISYSFMVQGQVDQILSNNPAERRTIFEEASGITKYKSQRSEALNKLQLVDQNLARVTDIIDEMSRQIGSLKRQANKALKYKQVQSRFKYLELAYNGHQFSQFNSSIGALSKNADGLRAEASQAQQAVRKKETDLNQQKSNRSELYNNIQAVQQTVYDLRSAKEQAERQAELAVLRREDLKNRIDAIANELHELNAQRETLTRQAADSSEYKQQQLLLVNASGDTFETKRSALLEIEKQVENLEGELEEKKQNLLLSEGEMVRLRSHCTSLEVDLKTYQVKHTSLSQNRFKLESEHVEITTQLETLKRNLAGHQEDQDRDKQSLSAEREETNRIREAFRNLQKEIQAADRELARQTAQLHILEELQKKFEGFSEGTRAILQGKLADLLPANACYLLTEQLKIETSYTQAFEALLGPAVDSIVVNDDNKIIPAIAELNTQQLGRACLQIPVPLYPTDQSGEERPAWLRPASEVIRAKREDLAPALKALLNDCYFCDNLEQFIHYWKENPSFNFLLVATQQGELINRRGFVYGGRVKGDNNTFLQRTIEIRKLKEVLREHQQTIDTLHGQAQKHQDELDKSEAQVESRQQQLVETERTLSILQAEERNALKELEQNNAEQESGKQELNQLELSGKASTDQLETAKAEMSEVENRLEQQRLTISTLEDALVKARQNRDIHRDAIAEVRLDVAEKKQGLALIDQGLEDIQDKLRALDESSLQREQEKDSIHTQIKGLEEEEQAQNAKATEVEITLKTTMESVEKDREALLAIENNIQTLEASLNSENARQRDLDQALNKLEVQLAEKRTQINFITEKIQNEYQVDISEINWKEALWKAETLHNRKTESFEDTLDTSDEGTDGTSLDDKPQQEPPEPTDEDYRAMDTTDWDAIGTEVKKLRDRLASMGPVNLVAIDEYNTLQKRYAFLKNQSEDLWNSKNELVRAIDDINKTSRELFETTFEQVRKNFKYTFDHLFGGGFADLNLIDPQETLDSGIEITARPPGTKLRGISLLSGGQKAMTAVALLFAIYMVKPSPICVLDELDAPLDDANIGRFTKILSQFTQYSQFLVVSHNKRTISVADTIYGVTMQERGVTELISVRFDHEKKSVQDLEETQKTEATAIDA